MPYSDFDMLAIASVDSVFSFILVFYGVAMLISLGLSVAVYVLQSFSLYRIARRRCIKKPWLAWLPLGNMWILGSISDQYQYVTQGKIRNKRTGLLVLTLLYILALLLFFPLLFAAIWQASYLLGLAVLALSLSLCALLISALIVEYLALYHLFASCDPSNKALYILLVIFVPVSLPILLFICRDKDLGMPPRRPEPEITSAPEENFEN